MDIDLYLPLWCYDCGHISQVSGSAHIKNCKCDNCGSKNFDFDRHIDEHTRQRLKQIAKEYKRNNKKK